MWLLGTTVVVALLVAAALGHVLQQGRRYQRLKGADFTAGARAVVLPRIAVVVPARNESRNIAACIDGLRRQFYPNDRLRVIVVDDNSTDDTAAIVRRIAQEDDRVTLIDAGALPPGWAGKPHACWRGARGATGEWLCFVDADTRAEPALLRTAVVAAQRRGLAMLSLAPRQELNSFYDRLLLPLGFLIIAATQDVTRMTGISPGGVVANGQFILVEAKAYFALGGHAAVRAAI
ncbi:MAG TPA: glycosyltransferase family A protein, partial [Rhizomicrobium sp.]|nr:glycosyltransferase family A protein [Rhizomicrobium sp.]